MGNVSVNERLRFLCEKDCGDGWLEDWREREKFGRYFLLQRLKREREIFEEGLCVRYETR